MVSTSRALGVSGFGVLGFRTWGLRILFSFGVEGSVDRFGLIVCCFLV